MSEPTIENPLALACLAFLDVETGAHLEAAAAAGFDDVTLRVTGSAGPVPGEIGLDPSRLAPFRTMLDSSGLGVLDVEVLRLAPDLDLSDVARVADAAVVLGARHLLVVNSGLDRAEATDMLGRVVELTKDSGVRPCLEPMLFSRCRTLSEAIATAGPTGAGVLVDALHLFRAGDGPTAVREAVDTHGSGLFPYLQVCDAGAVAPVGADALREEAVAARLLPGRGALPLLALLEQMPGGLPLSVESPTRALSSRPPGVRAVEAMRALRDVLVSPDR